LSAIQNSTAASSCADEHMGHLAHRRRTSAPRVTGNDIKASENASPVKTLRMRYDVWRKAGSKPFKTVTIVARR